MITKVKSAWSKALKFVTKSLKKPLVLKFLLNLAIFIVPLFFGAPSEISLPSIFVLIQVNVKR